MSDTIGMFPQPYRKIGPWHIDSRYRDNVATSNPWNYFIAIPHQVKDILALYIDKVIIPEAPGSTERYCFMHIDPIKGPWEGTPTMQGVNEAVFRVDFQTDPSWAKQEGAYPVIVINDLPALRDKIHVRFLAVDGTAYQCDDHSFSIVLYSLEPDSQEDKLKAMDAADKQAAEEHGPPRKTLRIRDRYISGQTGPRMDALQRAVQQAPIQDRAGLLARYNPSGNFVPQFYRKG